MTFSFLHILVWSIRLLSVAIALWWPALWCDPIYSPRQARMESQELRLPDGTPPATAEEQALALFWRWEHRTWVTTRWFVGPYYGLRAAQGRLQTCLVLIALWGVTSGALFVWGRKTAVTAEKPGRGKSWWTVWVTPLWQLFLRSR